MTTLNNLKKSDVLNAAIVVSKELSASAKAMEIKFNERFSAGMDTKKDKADLRAAQTKSAYFDNNILEAMRDDKQCGVFYFSIKIAKKDPELFFRETLANSYALEKLAYLMASMASGKCVFNSALSTNSRVFAMIEIIKKDPTTFSNGDVFKIMNKAKQENEMKPDATYTQANQLIKLFRDLGIVEAIKDGGKSEFGMAKFKFIKNDLFNHIATSFSK
ncbi:hypothetical protein ACO1ZI_15880 [Klebsiella pneumoniae]|uniref:hypothetical protein n=1 Tax=Klebsiella pneumoniae TaxID=573 RepID=UPI001CDB44D2|nr:hypothetical protein [Klebsiella pneumoniae]HBR1163581.1 hypothetical protein [Klebsiella quasipneumoniae subsp. similipneumoniae]HBT6210551.1 hypothetical protein [Klebsiella pneumoniae]HCI5972320.1 hypothetical protein [Klebsiella quasipneumoniae subsp. similipneumoniae]HCI6009989.1 hypothetical protein [Klebsiella quasipneumoniae subsp. similipneumoniae]